MSNCDIITSPIKFLGATVLSFNSSLGLGSSESTLKVDLIEDCANGDLFLPKNGSILVGAPVYFSAGQFTFGGVLQSWTVSQGGAGQTFTVDISDPRQLLANTVVIIDSYLGPPTQAPNYFNVYGFIEGEVLNGSCGVFGNSNSNERGMPYNNIISALTQMSPIIYSPTGYPFTINFNSFPPGAPEYYRIPGPSITLLDLLENICDVLGLEFYVDLFAGDVINIGTIDLKQPPSSFEAILTSYDGIATELSYGQELRNEITKTVVFGEKQHYLSQITDFSHFFGEDLIGDKFVPVVPITVDDCGFTISKKIDSLNSMLQSPFNTNGPVKIHELDIRCAMSTMDMWIIRAFDEAFADPGSLNALLQTKFPDIKRSFGNAVKDSVSAISDKAQQPIRAHAQANLPETYTELEVIYNWIKNLGNTFYGKQFIAPLNQRICYYQLNDSSTAEIVFSDIPTKAGGWVDDGIPVLGLSDPDLGLFREDDNRIGSFALFNDTGNPN
jgi:hypothetical protein